MATGMQGETIWSANANSANVALFCFAKMVSGSKFDLAGAGDPTLGVFTEVGLGSNVAGVPCSVQLDRVGKVILGAQLNAGSRVQSDGSGHAVAFSTGYLAGVTMLDGNSGDIVPIKLS